MIVDFALYRDGVREDAPEDLSDALAVARSNPQSFVWLGLHEPTARELEHVADEFKLHPLAVEDAIKAHQRPKVELYDDSIFLVLRTVGYDAEHREPELGDVMLFVGDAFVVTVRHGRWRALSEVRTRLERDRQMLDSGPSAVVYAVCDRIVDDYTSYSYSLEQDIEDLERRVFAPVRSNDAEAIYNLKREIIEFRHAVRPLVEPMEKFATVLIEDMPDQMRPFFRDVADHTVRVSEQVDGFDDLLSSVLSANLAQVGVQQNADMRRISAWVAIIAVPTMIAGIYGMNFEHMPELEWTFGYPATLAVMIVSCSVLYRAFRRSGWL